ncbi:MAG: hypothetical protein D6719_08290 [Candidatus Dadabacteria bacterium]|nr:MAG: hypothetical protein D6719_08290 [Candidatus Dadabacteria bacterium]
MESKAVSIGPIIQGSASTLVRRYGPIEAARRLQTALPATYVQSLEKSDAVELSISPAALFSQIEKHLDDVDKGRGYLSKDTARTINKLNGENSNKLGTLDPKAALDYSSYMSAGLTYDKRARMVEGVRVMADNMDKLQEAPDESAMAIALEALKDTSVQSDQQPEKTQDAEHA